MSRRFAVSDIHGCRLTFQSLLFDRLDLRRTDKLYLLGDYVDRGPDSKGVLDMIMRMIEDGYDITAIRGNHDDVFQRLASDHTDEQLQNWEIFGGTETLVSFNAFESGFDVIDSRYIDFVKRLPFYCETEGYVLVHAGVTTQGPMFDNDYVLMWTKNWEEYCDFSRLNGRRIIHGHVPRERSKIETRVQNWEYPVLGIDCGCCYVDREGMAHLCAFDLDTEELHFQANQDEVSFIGE